MSSYLLELKEEEYALIEKKAKLLGMTVSDFIRKAIFSLVEEKEKNLTEALNQYCETVSEEEQREIEELEIDFNDLDGEEVDIRELL